MSHFLNRMARRGVIYSKDVQNITGRSEATARRLLRKIRQHLNKPEGALITVREFCSCTGLDEDYVKDFMR